MILVTGAAGLNGTAIVRELSRQRFGVRALVRNRAKAESLASLPGVDLIEGDMARVETLGAALHGIERALMISSSVPQMVDTQCRFIDACKAAGVAHVVKFSGKESGAGFDPRNFRFTRMHEEIEYYLEASDLGWTHLRPSQFMQVYLREAPTIIGKGLLLLAHDDATLAPIDVEDIAKIAAAALAEATMPNRSLDMTGPEALTMNDIAAIISDVTGRTVRYVNVRPEVRRQAMLAAGLPEFTVDALDEQAAERRRRPRSEVDLRAHELFGVRPTTFREFVRRHVAVFGGTPS